MKLRAESAASQKHALVTGLSQANTQMPDMSE
jgi:hypothetical protein